MQRVIWLTVIFFVAFGVVPAADVPLRQRAMGVLILEDDTRLFGAALSDEGAREIRFLMRGTWLHENAPHLLSKIREQAAGEKPNERSDALADLLTEHLKNLRHMQTASAEQIGYLQERLDGLLSADSLPAENTIPDAVVLRLPSTLVRRQLRQKEHVRRLAGLAILNQLEGCELLSQSDLQTQLQKIPLAQRRQDLPQEIAAGHVGNGESVNRAQLQFGRILLDADRIFGKTCRLIFQSGQYLSDDQASAADVQQLATQMLTGQIQSQLQELLTEGIGPAGASAAAQHQNAAGGKPGDLLNPSAAAIADRERADVVEVTQLQMNPSAGSANVQIDVYYRLPGEKFWTLTAQVTGAATSRDISDTQKQRIANDPRVQQVTQLFGGLGSSGTDLTNAISIGACVETAQARAAEKLTELLKIGLPNGSHGGFSVLEAALSELPTEHENPKQP